LVDKEGGESSMDWLVQFSLPVFATTGVIVLAGRFTRRLGRRGRIAVCVTLLLLCVALGVQQYLEAASGVPVEQALWGGVVAAIGLAAIPIGVFFSIGYRLRSTTTATVAWFVASLPMAGYFLLLLLGVAGMTDCPPGAYECPI
jgi:hypothetical protein